MTTTQNRLYAHHGGYLLGHRCPLGHGGNRRLYLDRGRDRDYVECGGCSHMSYVEPLQWGFPSRGAAERADRAHRATWPADSAGDVLAGARR